MKGRPFGATSVELNALAPLDEPSIQPRRAPSEHVQLHDMVAIHQLSQAVALTIEPEVILDKVADAALSQFGADELSILLPTADRTELYVAVVRGTGREQILGERVPLSRSVAGWVARNRKGLRIDGGIHDARFTPAVSRPDIHSAISMPMVVGGQLVGVLNVSTTRRRRFTLGQVRALSILSSTAAAALQHAELYTQLHVAYDQLKKAQDQIVQQERMRALGQMASGIAHDFNNALVPVLGFSELLLAEPTALTDPERVRRGLEMIRTGAQDAANMVGRLREFYRRREEGEIFQPVNLSRLIEQVVSLTKPRWRDQAMALGITIHLETDLDPGLPLISGNEAELREAMMNLVFNSVDAMATSGRLILKTRSNGSWVEAEVTDNGSGMTEFVREHCQEPLFSTKGEHGTGLGLAMVYGIVLRHEGTVDITTAVGVGTTVRIRLPIDGRPPPDAEPTEVLPVATRLRVLVVDDQPAVREVLEAYLAYDGHLVQSAPSGSEAIRLFQQNCFDVVITDRGMPEMSGDELARVLKGLSPRTPVILLTGFGDLMRAAGEQPDAVDAVVPKPVEMGHLRKALARLLSESNQLGKEDPSPNPQPPTPNPRLQ